ncbi:hypothetical protein [Agrococcus sp. Ld7]|uniref:hypothetical protein n=1 Tax=Agrococcus sp. Ld7 TaxID=649148 RepID=UPI00386FBB07
MRGVAAALIDVGLPHGVGAAALMRLRVPLGVAVAASMLGALLGLLALVDLARLLVGAGAVSAVLALALLLLPAATLMLGVPSGPRGAIVHAAPLLRAIDLGHSLAAAWRAAALLSPIAPVAAAGLASAAVLIARGAVGSGAAVAAAAVAGALIAWLAADRGARALETGASGQAAPWRALAQAVLTSTVALGVAAAAPLLEPDVRAVLGPAAIAAALAIAVHLAGELLGLDARRPLLLARSMIGCGAAPWRFVVAVVAGAGGCAGLLGTAAALAVAALGGTPSLVVLLGVAVAHVIASAIAVLVVRPAASDVMPRVVLMAVALVPAGVGLAGGSWIGLAAAVTVALSVVGCVTASRLR